MLCLGIETSCDETALALVRDGKCVESVLATQMDVHALFGGVVPEIASREHYRFLGALYDELMRHTGLTLADVDVVAVTRGPGLLGALLVGVAFAKGLSLAGNKPLIAVNHLHAHLLAVGLEHELLYPLLGLLVSGGHTHIYRIDAPESLELLGHTLDDAAGEACDKFAKMLGLPYPGGVLLDRLAQRGAADAHLFPRPYTHVDNLDFSFSGLKTSFLYSLRDWLKEDPDFIEHHKVDLAASLEATVVDILMDKLRKAAKEYKINEIAVAGGVSANNGLRNAFREHAEKYGWNIFIPKFSYTTDNAAMIAITGYFKYLDKDFCSIDLPAYSRVTL